MTADRKRKGKKNKLEEIQKPRGYERGLTMNRIVGATDCTGALQFLVSWYDCDEYDLLAANEVNDKSPDIVISYYEQRCMLNQKCEKRRKIQEQYELDLIEYPPTDLPPVSVESENKTSNANETRIDEDSSTNVDNETINNDVTNETTSSNQETGVEQTDETTANEIDNSGVAGAGDTDHYHESGGNSSMAEQQNIGNDQHMSMSDDISDENIQNQSHEQSNMGGNDSGDVIPDDIQMPNPDNY